MKEGNAVTKQIAARAYTVLPVVWCLGLVILSLWRDLSS